MVRCTYTFQIVLVVVFLAVASSGFAQNPVDELFEDVQFKPAGEDGEDVFFTSKNVDFIQIPSSISDTVKFGIVVYKPEKPSRILLISHGWHMSVKPPKNSSNPFPDFLTIQVDMRGRKYSTGKQDCNGFELYDYYDAYQYALKNYGHLIEDEDQLYFNGGSGGGGNGLGLLGKFPDLFCSAIIRSPISDYALWFEQDSIVKEFRDELIPWIGTTPDSNLEAYNSRSGLTTIANLLTPTYIIHGGLDVRVPVSQSRIYVDAGVELRKPINYLMLGSVGTRSHWGNITSVQEDLKNQMEVKGLEKLQPPILPAKGELVVAGYVVTKHFSVFLESIDQVGKITYDLTNKSIEFLEGSGEITWFNAYE